MTTKITKINWQRVARSALRSPEYPDRLLDDIRRETGKDEWTLQELNAMWKRAAACTDTWGTYCKQETKRWS